MYICIVFVVFLIHPKNIFSPLSFPSLFLGGGGGALFPPAPPPLDETLGGVDNAKGGKLPYLFK